MSDKVSLFPQDGSLADFTFIKALLSLSLSRVVKQMVGLNLNDVLHVPGDLSVSSFSRLFFTAGKSAVGRL